MGTCARRFGKLSQLAGAITFFAPMAGLPLAQAGDLKWNPPSHGYVIQGGPADIPQEAGSLLKVTGTITFVGDSHGKPDSLGKCHNGTVQAQNRGNGSKKCPPLPSLVDQLAEDGVQVQALYPDNTVDATRQLTLTGTERGIQFSFTSAEVLKASDLNRLTFQVIRTHPETQGLQKVQSRFDVRIRAFTQKINELAGLPSSPELVQQLLELRSMRDKLVAVSNKIADKLKTRTQLVAQMVAPIQVDNIVSGNGLNLSTQGHFRIQTISDQGTAIQGMKTQFHTTISHLPGFPAQDEVIDANFDGDHDQFVAKYFWKNALVNQLPAQSIPVGASVTFDYATPARLHPSDVNVFTAQIFSWDADNNKLGREFGSLSYLQPVARDETFPLVLAGASPDAPHSCVYNMQPAALTILDGFGLMDAPTVHATISGTLNDGTLVPSSDVTSKLTVVSPDQGQTIRIEDHGSTNPAQEGVYTYAVSSRDLAGNATLPNPYQQTFRINRTAPIIQLAVNDAATFTNKPYTNRPGLSFGATVIDYFDRCEITTAAWNNGVEFDRVSSATATFATTMHEGLNFIVVTSNNMSNSLSAPTGSFPAILDTIPAILSEITPSEGAVLNTLSFTVKFKSNEPLLDGTLGSQPMVIGADGKSASATFTAPTEGLFTLPIQVRDLATNITSVNIHVQVLLRALNGDLLSVTPDADGIHLLIKGAPGATRPGLTVRAEANFFNRGTAAGASNGSFSIRLNSFQSAVVTATDPSLGRTDSATVRFGGNNGTSLSGTVRDIFNQPLVGATVSIVSAGLSTTTDASGVFKFTSPVTGDQTILIDGNTSAQPLPPAPARKYSRTNVAITIGMNFSNVLSRPIYLAHIPQDGTATEINTSAGGTVLSPNAPGVELKIPAGAAHFPDQAATGQISLTTIDAAVSTVAPPGFAVPKKVIALEPSGLTFSAPVEVTLPNDSNLPVGLDVVIFSMASNKGVWEIDGVGTVIDANTIRTKPSAGITHFSIIYAAPVGPKVAQMGVKDRIGADMFNGAVSTSISLPSVKIHGQDVAASLIYRSSWAVPTTLMTNLFSLPDPSEKLEFTRNIGLTDSAIVRIQTDASISITNYPKEIRAKFATTNVETDTLHFDATNAPKKAAVSFAVELKECVDEDCTIKDFLKSDAYPYTSHYEIDYENVIVSTVSQTVDGPFSTEVTSQEPQEERKTQTIYPPDLTGTIHVQNHSRSPAGSGWKLTGAQKILNPASDSVTIEESDGSLSTYVINNTIQTVFNAGANDVDLGQGADIFGWPNFTAVKNNQQIVKGSLLSGSITSGIGSLHTLSGRVTGWRYTNNEWDGWDDDEGSICQEKINSFVIRARSQQLVTLSSGLLLGTDSNMNSVFRLSGSVTDPFVRAPYVTPPTYSFNYIGSPFCESDPVECPHKGAFYNEEVVQVNNYCNSIPGMSCTQTHFRDHIGQNYNACGSPPLSNGSVPASATFNGDGGSLTSRALNGPAGISPGPRPNTVVVADYGNHRVRLIDLDANRIDTIAGNGSGGDSGDGGFAANAGVFHPRGVVYDGVGNLYISTQSGKVRKIDTAGRISTIVGASGATPGDNRLAKQVLLNNPFGLVVDTDKKFLYIAETGAHMVRKVDLNTDLISSVAGNGFSAGYNGESNAALASNLSSPTLLGLDSTPGSTEHNLLIVDSGNQRIRRVIFQNAAGGLLAFVPASQNNSTLTRDGAGNWTRRFRSGVTVQLDSQGRQTTSTDRLGQTTNFAYTSATGPLASVTYPSGAGTTTYQYQGDKLASILDSAGRSTAFSYNGAGQLTRVTFPDLNQRFYAYNVKGLLERETNEKGVVTRYIYNEWNRVASVTRAEGLPEVSTSVINDLGSATAANNYTAESKGTLKSSNSSELNRIQTGAQSVSVAMSADGFIQKIVGSDGKGTWLESNYRGQPTRLRRGYDDRGTESVADDTWQSEVTYVYDETAGRIGDLLSQTDTESGISTARQLDDFGHVIKVTNARGKISTSQFDAATGRLLSQTDPLGRRTEYQYQSGTELVSILTRKVGGVTILQSSTTYDAKGNALAEVDPVGSTVTYERDAAGNILKATIAEASGPKREIHRHEFDSMNRLTGVTTPKGEKTLYQYTETGKISQVQDPLGQKIQYAYNGLDQVTRKTDQIGMVSTFGYNSTGQLATEVDPNGNSKAYEYDAKGNLTKKTLPDNIYAMNYDDLGHLTSVSDARSQVEMTYDSLDQVRTTVTRGLASASSYPQITLSQDFDNNGSRSELRDSTGAAFTYNHDDGDRLTSIINPRTEVYGWSYQDAARKMALSRPGLNSEWVADARGLATHISHKASSSGATVSQFDYLYDYLGSRIQTQTLSTTLQFSYDLNRQLASSENPEVAAPFASESFEYDSIGNRTSDQQGGFQYDTRSQRLTEDYRYFYYYDNNGNLTKKQGKAGFPLSEVTNYSYSSENQVLGFKVYAQGSTTPSKEVSYIYDAFGRRMRKVVLDHAAASNLLKSFTRQYVYDGQEIYSEYDGSNRLLARYTHSGANMDDVLAVEITQAGVDAKLAQSAGSFQYLKDAQGTVHDVADSSGNQVQHYLYSSYGILLGIRDAQANDVTASPPVNTSYGFTGREHDSESGLMYYRARYYDPNTGRFLQKDSHPGILKVPGTVNNSYIYALNDPLNRVDPSGRFSWFEKALIAVAAIVVAVVAVVAAPFTAGGSAVLGGIIEGAILGAIVGGLVGAGINVYVGRDWDDSIGEAILIGAVAGGIAGGITAAITGGAQAGTTKLADSSEWIKRVKRDIDKIKDIMDGALDELNKEWQKWDPMPGPSPSPMPS